MVSYAVKPLSPETWDDFEQLFVKHKGVRGGCWCMYHRLSSSEFNRLSKEERRERHKELTLRGKGHGLLVYDGQTPVAWCHFGPADVFIQYDRSRAYSRLAIAPEHKPDWRIACIFVDKHHRKQGLSAFTLHATMQMIRGKGGGVIEAFPLHVPGVERPSYTGSIAMYEREGFEEVCPLGVNKILMRRIMK
ncbi:MAG: GNAT family N-acetyltransferase [Firmicutes bacterium]|nr:GNAT family N-acetyltransferase [Bacillota bacterium]